MSVLAVHALPLQTLLGASESVQLDGAALELTPILCNLLLGPAKGILIKLGSVRQMLHTHCRNDKKGWLCFRNQIYCTTPHTTYRPVAVYVAHLLTSRALHLFHRYVILVLGHLTCPLSTKVRETGTNLDSVHQSVSRSSDSAPYLLSMNEAHCCSQLDPTQGRSFSWHLSLAHVTTE